MRRRDERELRAHEVWAAPPSFQSAEFAEGKDDTSKREPRRERFTVTPKTR
jgi:hypothetical protein